MSARSARTNKQQAVHLLPSFDRRARQPLQVFINCERNAVAIVPSIQGGVDDAVATPQPLLKQLLPSSITPTMMSGFEPTFPSGVTPMMPASVKPLKTSCFVPTIPSAFAPTMPSSLTLTKTSSYAADDVVELHADEFAEPLRSQCRPATSGR